MVCYPDPCECGPKKKAPAKRAPRKRPVEEQAMPVATGATPPAPRPDLRARMKAAAAKAPPTPPPPKPTRVAAKAPTLSDDDLLLNAAIRNLAGVLHEDEKARWGMVASSTPSQAERAAEWKARRRWHVSQ